MNHPLRWAAIAYVLLYAIAVGTMRYDFHKGGCRICTKYIGNCPCGYTAIELSDLSEDRPVEMACILALLVIEFPLILAFAYFVAHTVIPLHKKRCLAFVLEGEK